MSWNKPLEYCQIWLKFLSRFIVVPIWIALLWIIGYHEIKHVLIRRLCLCFCWCEYKSIKVKYCWKWVLNKICILKRIVSTSVRVSVCWLISWGISCIYMRQVTTSPLFKQCLVTHLFGVKQLHESILIYCQSSPNKKETTCANHWQCEERGFLSYRSITSFDL